eukprot:PhF_6_TR19795/c0_g1_i1/m.28862/K18693/DPP1, DPPL, PLPP4_5; diacylglycerol diphosphate phosphatase / phosphatidate phosphatase
MTFSWFGRSQILDWITVGVLYFVSVYLDASHWFFCQPYSATDPTISYPLVPNTIKTSMLLVMGMVPLCLFFSLHVIGWTSTHELHNSVLGYIQSVVTANGVITALKLYVGRLRPDFLDRLRQSGYTQQQIENWAAMCYVYDDVVLEGRKSFPSGACGVTFASMTFVFLYILWKWKVMKRGQLFPLLVAMLPIVFALFVCSSRLRDFWHHGSDVVAGCILGLVLSSLCFEINFEVKDDGELAPRSRMPANYEDLTYFTTH